MAKKKIYAVRRGHSTGIFYTWDECKKATAGYSGPEFRGFYTEEEARAFLEEGTPEPEDEGGFDMPPGGMIAYVDGSFDASLERYSFGCVLLTPDGEITRESGSGNNPECLAIRNVAGEMLGAMTAVKWAAQRGFSSIELRYDYEGIEKWVTGAWRAKTELTKQYAAYMQGMGTKITVTFRKIAAHTGDLYNEEADKLAKKALTEDRGGVDSA